jgi:glycosyltransferase involved in cell wall biosynthesis
MITLSVITISYNSILTIEETIKSYLILKEKCKYSLEYIIVDGGSTDGTIELIEKYRNSIDHLKIEEDGGIYDAMNKGVRLANGVYLTHLNSDDQFIPQNILLAMEQITLFNYDYVYGNIDRIHNGIYIKTSKPISKRKSQLLGNIIPHIMQPGLIIKKNVFGKIGEFDTSYKILGDLDFLYRLIKSDCFKAKYLDLSLVKFNIGGASSGALLYPEYRKMVSKFKIPIIYYYIYIIRMSIIRFIFKYLKG